VLPPATGLAVVKRADAGALVKGARVTGRNDGAIVMRRGTGSDWGAPLTKLAGAGAGVLAIIGGTTSTTGATNCGASGVTITGAWVGVGATYCGDGVVTMTGVWVGVTTGTTFAMGAFVVGVAFGDAVGVTVMGALVGASVGGHVTITVLFLPGVPLSPP
jgi:hypothetical protein